MPLYKTLGFGICGFAVLALPAVALASGMETVVVTAAPPDPLGNAAFSTVTLSAADLSFASRLDEDLLQVPGLSLFRRNSSLSANPTVQGVSLRSIAPSGAGRALVTLDGVPQNDPFGGWVIWSALPPVAIARAEIVRGAGAGPYGAGALTGVVALTESSGDGFAGEASWGERQSGHVAAAGGATLGPVALFASASVDSSAGWIALDEAQRGAADVPVSLNARSASLRAQTAVREGTLLSARIGLYDEARHSGLGQTASEASGLSASLTLAHPQQAGETGWRLQVWLRSSDLFNSSASVSPDRSLATPANEQYATPAVGFGLNAALRGSFAVLDWEVGADARFARGNSREQFSWSPGIEAFTQGRISGGKTSVAGLYAEGASRMGNLLITLGARADRWSSYGGHLIQTVFSSGATTTTLYRSKSGIVPTARAGVRYDLSDRYFLRGAAYAGFRAPTLNELYRPFRVGNVTTAANPDLSPEKYYGIEIGFGGTMGAFSWDGDIFLNRLHAAIANVTTGVNTFQRQNAGNIDAPGFEAQANYRVGEGISLRAAFALTDAHIRGLRPAQTPRWTVTAGFEAMPVERIVLSANLRYESNRFSDDRNTLPLGSATTVDMRLSYQVSDRLSMYLAADNLLNSDVATSASAAVPVPIVTYDAPRMVRIGVSFTR